MPDLKVVQIFFYMLINAPTLKCAFIENEAFPVFTTMKQRLKECKQLTISFELMVAFLSTSMVDYFISSLTNNKCRITSNKRS